MCFARSSADVKSPTDGFYFIAAHQASLSNLLLEFLVIGAKPAPTRAADFQGLIFLASGHEQPGKNNVIYLEEVRGLSWASAPLCSWREHKCRALCLPCSCFQHVETVLETSSIPPWRDEGTNNPGQMWDDIAQAARGCAWRVSTHTTNWLRWQPVSAGL